MKKFDLRHRIIQIVVISAATVLITKLAHLQLFSADFKDRANQAALFQKTTFPSRGLILDRNGKLMVVNEPIYELQVINNELDPNMDTLLLCDILGISRTKFETQIEKDWSDIRYSKSIPYRFMHKIGPPIYARFQEFLHQFPGFYPNIRNVRAYPQKSAAHVLGYLSEISPYELEKKKDIYQLGDYVGASGLEKSYEDILKGEKGSEFVLKDNMGREVGTFANGALNSYANSGVDLISSLDIELQNFGENLLKNKRGSIVALEPSTGQVLSMVSMPNYDPNLLSIGKSRTAAFKELERDIDGKPFLDRSVMSKYPPGSIFKPILSLIALQEGITQADRTIHCDGRYITNKKRGFSQGCRNHPTPYNISIAIQHSCNSYFYQLIREFIEIDSYSKPEIGLNLLIKHLNEFGIGVRLGVDNLYEHPGNVPTPEYYDKKYEDVFYGWRATYILSLGIGQGELELTTLQMANLAAILANRGHFYTPHLVKGFSNASYQMADNYTIPKKVSIDSIHFPPVIDGMKRVVHSGSSAYVPDLDICGKTGTSQNPHGKDHSVFFAFAPKDDPKIAIAVYVENAGSGGSMAAPIAGLMIEKYLKGTVAENRKWLEERIINTIILTNPKS